MMSLNGFFNLNCKSKLRNLILTSQQSRLCSIAAKTSDETKPTTKETKPKPKKKSSKVRVKRIQQFLERYPQTERYIPLIPEQYLHHLKKNPDNLYLIDENVAKKVASHLLPRVLKKKDHIVCEANPGLCFICKELLENNVEMVRLYEPSADFKHTLNNLKELYRGRVEIVKKDFLRLYSQFYQDKMDRGDRLTEMFDGVPKKDWTDDPVMTIIGTATRRFINFLLFAIVRQNRVVSHGRLQFYFYMNPSLYQSFTAGPEAGSRKYSRYNVLFNLLFDCKIVDKFPREVFLPWEYTTQTAQRKHESPDRDFIYFVRINFKQELPMAAEHLNTLMTFLTQFFGVKKSRVVPSLEQWVPGSGLNAMIPQFPAKDYFKNMNIFTEFHELTPKQVVYVFNELIEHPDYEMSPFLSIVESELVLGETVDTALDDHYEQKSLSEN